MNDYESDIRSTKDLSCKHIVQHECELVEYSHDSELKANIYHQLFPHTSLCWLPGLQTPVAAVPTRQCLWQILLLSVQLSVCL